MKSDLVIKQQKILEKLRKTYGNKALDTDQLNKIGQLLLGNEYCGTYSYDQYPSESPSCSYAIINTDNHKQPGTHWISVYKKDKTLYIFDSFGRFSKNILKKFVKSHKAEGFKIVDVNHKTEQGNNQQDCGLRAMTTLLLIRKFGIESVFN